MVLPTLYKMPPHALSARLLFPKGSDIAMGTAHANAMKTPYESNGQTGVNLNYHQGKLIDFSI